ncbi:MAG: energy-coupling factor transporter transmembrane component T [Oscillospiraceae bacterium]
MEYRIQRLERVHPLCAFAYMLCVAGITIATRHPVMLGFSAVGAIALLAYSGRSIAAYPIMALVTAVINPIFSHNGATVLFFAGNIAVTAEAFVYGALFGVMLACVTAWSVIGSAILSSDKWIWLFGRIAPAAGLTLSCAMRFVPLFAGRVREFSQVQKANTLRGYLSAFGAAVSWSAEEAIISADSMKSRGYGLARRTAFALYRFGRRDMMILTFVVLISALCIISLCMGGARFYCYPAVSTVKFRAWDIAAYISFGALCIAPISLAACDNLKRAACWKKL